MLKILYYPAPILREKIPEFDFQNPTEDPVQLEKDMLETMYRNNGIGLSANQVGKRIRMFVMGNSLAPEEGRAFFNPMVVAHTDDLDDLPEGCLSFPEIFVKVKRPKKIKARWQNSRGEWQEGEFTDYACKCFLHELDHLEGITFQDRVSELRWNLAKNKRKNNVRTR
jgi:peptide deformylase